MKNKFLFAALLLISSLGCKKNDSAPPAVSTKTSTVSSSTWKFNNAGLDTDKNGTIEFDVSSQIPSCVLDNTVKFQTDGSGTADEGASKCNTGDLQTIPFTWAFASSETVINITGNAIAGKGGQYKILALDDTQFKLSKDTTYLGTQIAFIVNLKH